MTFGTHVDGGRGGEIVAIQGLKFALCFERKNHRQNKKIFQCKHNKTKSPKPRQCKTLSCKGLGLTLNTQHQC